MKKTFHLFILLTFLVIGGSLFLTFQAKQICLQIEEDDSLSIKLLEGQNQKILYPWANDGGQKQYFFLPAFAGYGISVKSGEKNIYINGEKYTDGEKFHWESSDVYMLEIYDEVEKRLTASYEIVFMKSENISSLFIDTASGSMEMVNDEGIEYQEPGMIEVVSSEGQIEYRGSLERISLRGNSTKGYPKKPYAIKLGNAEPLCGMPSGKRWNLLALWREGSKMNSKIVYDMAEEIGMENSVASTWVDLYLNGEYAGIYLLCEAVTMGDDKLEKENEANNPDIELADPFEYENMKGFDIDDDGIDITGGYLVEKEVPAYYAKESNGFLTDKGTCFVIKQPQYASINQVEYIKNYVSNIENLIVEKDTEYFNYIDLDSFTKKFLIDEITLNYDAGVTSAYFYKKRGDDTLYAGPAWDYDTALGCVPSIVDNGDIWNSYAYSILSAGRAIGWYQILYENDEFYKELLRNYENMLPYLDEVISSRIDEYASLIQASVKMNEVRWKEQEPMTEIGNAGHYLSFQANVKYLKYFLAKRLNYLNNKWEIEYEELNVFGSDAEHKVVLLKDEKQDVFYVKDGTLLDNLPYLDEQMYQGWYITVSDEQYFDKLPIYEDIVLYAKRQY